MTKTLTEREKMVFDYVKQNPRKTPTEIAKALGLPNSSYVANALSMLEHRNGLIKRREIVCYE